MCFTVWKAAVFAVFMDSLISDDHLVFNIQNQSY